MTTRKSKTIRWLEKMNEGPLTLGQILNAHRLSEEMTLADFAKKLKMSVSYLNDLEKGTKFASPEKAAEYAKYLGMSEKLYVQMAMQERLDRAGIKLKVEIKSA